MACSLYLHFPHPFSIAHRTAVFKERDFFPVCQSYWESASHAYLHGTFFSSSERPSHFFSQIIGVNTPCAYELVGRCFRLLEWLVWAFRPGKGAERCQSGDGRKENCFPAWRTCRKPPASLQTLLRDQPPLPPSPPSWGVSSGPFSRSLRSTKHNTNVGLLDLSSSAPIYFTRNTHVSCRVLFVVPIQLFTPCPFPPHWRVVLVNLTPPIRFGLWRQQAVKGTRIAMGTLM